VDSFHTSYNLLALHELRTLLDEGELTAALERGAAYWRGAFLGGPAVGFRPHVAYPIDVHAVAHAILTLLALDGTVIHDGAAMAARLGDWALSEMRSERGYFYYERHRRYTNRIPYMRWTQAWMLRALSELAVRQPEPLQ
jgi:hypothetical protein